MEFIIEELQIPKLLLKSTSRDGRFVGVVPKSWLKALKTGQLDTLTNTFETWPYTQEELGESWIKLFITVYKKNDSNVIPLPRIRKLAKDNTPLLFCQLLQYISETNYKSLWKEVYKKYSVKNNNVNSDIASSDYNTVLREIISRIYQCPIIDLIDQTVYTKYYEDCVISLNILPAICCVESNECIYLFHVPYIEHNLNDCVTFSPAILNRCYTKPLFIIYQLLQVLKTLHDQSITLGDIELSDVYLTEDLWLYVFPQLTNNLHVQNANKNDTKTQFTNSEDCRTVGHKFDSYLKCLNCGIKTYDRVQVNTNAINANLTLDNLCKLWIEGQISNFTYLTALNNLSGRKFGNPNCHHVFPWVTDFTARNGKNWRDLKKSKYRLNKGDRQLDLTYETSQTQIPHHVSDILSPITYYVYMSRRTPKSVLCKYVRPVWVPEEYPSSIKRLQEWSPDECIPEFYCDPTVFKTIHDDLDDLEVPNWSSSPEDFIEQHREALESSYVSDRLHHWIDLTFGYKLTGHAAIKAKNVCLHLVDEHSDLTDSGLVQLFTHPHPPKSTQAAFFSKLPPKIYVHRNAKSRHSSKISEISKSEDETTAEEDILSSSSLNTALELTKAFSRSRQSLYDELRDQKSSRSNSQRSISLGSKTPSFTSHVPRMKQLSIPMSSLNSGVIYLPKEYNPAYALNALENIHSFYSKTFQKGVDAEIIPKQSVEETNNKLTDIEIINYRKTKEMQVLGCLIMEIFFSKQLRALGGLTGSCDFNTRLQRVLTLYKSLKQDIPSCIKYIVQLLLQPKDDSTSPNNNPSNTTTSNFTSSNFAAISNIGLPGPNGHFLLEPLLNCVIPFSNKFHFLYKLLSNLKDFQNTLEELNILYHVDCDGLRCKEFETLEKTKFIFGQNISESKVKLCTQQLDLFFKEIDIVMDSEIIEILVCHVKNLLEDPSTSVLTCWYLFDPLAKYLGPERTSKKFLHSILKLYENLAPYNKKLAKLYHHSFLLRIIVRFGLRCFLDNFITPLVEAVGGYKDIDCSDFVVHSHTEKFVKKGNLKLIVSEDQTSPSDDSSDSEHITLFKESETLTHTPEYENTEMPYEQENLETLIKHLELNITTDIPLSHTNAEEAIEAIDEGNVGNLDELKLDLLEDDEEESSPPTSDPKLNVDQQTPEKSNSLPKSDLAASLESPSESYIETHITSVINSNSDVLNNTILNSCKRDVDISDISSDSLLWLSHRLGPVLTARYLARNLLKMLSLCYVGKENLMSISREEKGDSFYDCDDFISIASSYVVGDRSAARVLDCLTSIAALYGEQIILLQYLPHMGELIALCKRRLSFNLEGGLISCLSLLKHIIPYLSDSALMDHLHDTILKNIMHPTVRLLGTTKFCFPNGATARNVLARKYVDALYVLSLRMGSDLSKIHLNVPALQRFFLIFDRANEEGDNTFENSEVGSYNEKKTLEVKEESACQKLFKRSESSESLSTPPQSPQEDCLNEAVVELQQAFTMDLAYVTYVPFLKQIGLTALESSLKNLPVILNLCHKYENLLKQAEGKGSFEDTKTHPSDGTPEENFSKNLESRISVVGNRIDFQTISETSDSKNYDLLSLISSRMDNSERHLRGNWLAYWEHEIGRSDKDVMFNFKQIKLQTFSGHSGSVKSIYVIDNENSFLSGSRDKTIKLWSLRSQGDGTNISSCQWTYTAHRKSVLSVAFLESLRLCVSTDSVVHIWDPFMGGTIKHLESHKNMPVNVLKSVPAPSCQVLAATTEGTIKFIDIRQCNYMQELKVSTNPTGLIRCLVVPPSGNWVAAGQSSGNITVLDLRTGLVIANWRAHESEVLQMVSVGENTLVSSSFDQSISVWNVHDGKFNHSLKGTMEPAHCLNLYNSELISGTTANRIGVHTSVNSDASFSSTKLRSDTFRGLLTSMAVMPLNRLLLLGADNGTINLLC